MMAQRWLIAACLVVLCVSSLNAQPPGHGRFARSRWLVELDPVQSELDINESQSDLLDALCSDLNRQREAILHGDDAPRSSNEELEQERRKSLSSRLAKFDRQSEALIGTVLNGEQAVRLQQLYVQRDGAQALDRPEVAEKLQITDEQRKDLLEVRATFAKKLQETFMARRDQFRNRTGFEETLRDADRLRAKELDEIRKLLNEEQQSRFNELTGEPFDFATIRQRGRTRN